MMQRAKADVEGCWQVHESFSKATLACQGTFYLPYRHHYNDAEMHTS